MEYYCKSETLTTEAHGWKLNAGAVGVNHHHPGAVVPLQFKTSGTTDQVHVACVIDFKAVLLESRFGIPRIHVELKGNKKV